MPISYKQKCFKCRKNWVTVTRRDKFVICYDCQKETLNQKIKDPKMKKLFNIPEEFYRENSFLRNIKMNYIRFEKLSEKQIQAFKQTVEKMKQEKKTKS
ncbi:hypothetical protein KY342_06375 [Candidatus Woesearchaeota archaeon]|nr:hypothetical protein [Candidatus Woesearchaeota archaeon]